jgi:hypothetical protein
MRQQNGPPADSTPGALEEYLAAAEAGTAPPREQFLARHPELAEDLDACLAAVRFIGRAAAGPGSLAAEAAGAQPPEQVTGQLGDFRLIREVGRGGMGVVYEAEQVSLGRRVALKVLPFAATMDSRQLQRFHNEARAAASLDHPHIVPVYGVGCERGVHYYTMKLIDGRTLAGVVGRQRGADPANTVDLTHAPSDPATPTPAAETTPNRAADTSPPSRGAPEYRRAAEWIAQAAEALEYAHALGIVHRDVKPANLMLDGQGRLWVTDFGLARVGTDAGVTMTDDVLGTLRYMSPEQERGGGGQAEVRDAVLTDRGRFRVVHGPRQRADEPAPLKVKDVRVEGRRYVVCVNAEEVESDRARREAIVAALREQLTRGDKALVGNKGYRRYLKVEGEGHFAIDEAKLQAEARYDGTWVLRTNTDWPAAEVALRYKKLWLVEHWFRACKSLVETRPVYHQRDETIRGHVFCSFLALVLRHELQARLEARGHDLEWAEVLEDLERVQYVEVEHGGKRFLLRSELQGTAGRVFQAAGVAAPPTVQQVTEA